MHMYYITGYFIVHIQLEPVPWHLYDYIILGGEFTMCCDICTLTQSPSYNILPALLMMYTLYSSLSTVTMCGYSSTIIIVWTGDLITYAYKSTHTVVIYALEWSVLGGNSTHGNTSVHCMCFSCTSTLHCVIPQVTCSTMHC